MKATGTFDVRLTPAEAPKSEVDGVATGRMTIEKTFQGTLSATSRGEMLTAMTPVKGSAGYVAVEQITGHLGEKEGSFVLQHFGIMNRGEDHLTLEVVPDSGTGQLKGISGEMIIRVADGHHSYDFEYELGG